MRTKSFKQWMNESGKSTRLGESEMFKYDSSMNYAIEFALFFDRKQQKNFKNSVINDFKKLLQSSDHFEITEEITSAFEGNMTVDSKETYDMVANWINTLNNGSYVKVYDQFEVM